MQDAQIRDLISKIHNKVRALKNASDNLVVESYQEDSNKLLKHAENFLDIIYDLKDLNHSLNNKLIDYAWVNRLKGIVADIPDELISVRQEEDKTYTILVDGEIYSEQIDYSETSDQLHNLKDGYEIGRKSKK